MPFLANALDQFGHTLHNVLDWTEHGVETITGHNFGHNIDSEDHTIGDHIQNNIGIASSSSNRAKQGANLEGDISKSDNTVNRADTSNHGDSESESTLTQTDLNSASKDNSKSDSVEGSDPINDSSDLDTRTDPNSLVRFYQPHQNDYDGITSSLSDSLGMGSIFDGMTNTRASGSSNSFNEVYLNNDPHNITVPSEPGHFKLVEFYAEGCPHSQDLQPRFRNLAKMWKDVEENNLNSNGNGRNNVHVDFEKVQCHNENWAPGAGAMACQRNGIRSYPTVRLYYEAGTGSAAPGGEGLNLTTAVVPFKGPRTEQNLMNFLKYHTNLDPSAIRDSPNDPMYVDPESELMDLLTTNAPNKNHVAPPSDGHHQIVKYYAEECPHSKAMAGEWEKVSHLGTSDSESSSGSSNDNVDWVSRQCLDSNWNPGRDFDTCVREKVQAFPDIRFESTSGVVHKFNNDTERTAENLMRFKEFELKRLPQSERLLKSYDERINELMYNWKGDKKGQNQIENGKEDLVTVKGNVSESDNHNDTADVGNSKIKPELSESVSESISNEVSDSEFKFLQPGETFVDDEPTKLADDDDDIDALINKEFPNQNQGDSTKNLDHEDDMLEKLLRELDAETKSNNGNLSESHLEIKQSSMGVVGMTLASLMMTTSSADKEIEVSEELEEKKWAMSESDSDEEEGEEDADSDNDSESDSEDETQMCEVDFDLNFEINGQRSTALAFM